MSTKQINQRFKLAEDYAYKASVAKAYEGYKNEACKVSDGEFEKRLFDSALSRLEEAPLRFVKDEDHTTPWTEMLNSKSFQKFLDASIDNVNYVKGIISKKGQSAAKASNDEVNHIEKLKNEAWIIILPPQVRGFYINCPAVNLGQFYVLGAELANRLFQQSVCRYWAGAQRVWERQIQYVGMASLLIWALAIQSVKVIAFRYWSANDFGGFALRGE